MPSPCSGQPASGYGLRGFRRARSPLKLRVHRATDAVPSVLASVLGDGSVHRRTIEEERCTPAAGMSRTEAVENTGSTEAMLKE